MRRLDVRLAPETWRAISGSLRETAYPAGAVIMSQAKVSEHWMFLSRGLAASEQTLPNGGTAIARFFEAGQICTNLTSAWSRDIANDDLIAITDVEGLLAPDAVFREALLYGQGFGVYLRLKLMETLLFDKEIICAKTAGDTETRYRFLEERHDAVIAGSPKKDVARFLGVTPQGLSRFLKKRSGEAMNPG